MPASLQLRGAGRGAARNGLLWTPVVAAVVVGVVLCWHVLPASALHYDSGEGAECRLDDFGLSGVPRLFDMSLCSNAGEVLLTGNNISALRSQDLSLLRHLRSLRLGGNALTSLPEGVFDGEQRGHGSETLRPLALLPVPSLVLVKRVFDCS